MSYQAAPAAAIGRADESRRDAMIARELLEEVLEQRGERLRNLGPDRLIAMAQVYATLATR